MSKMELYRGLTGSVSTMKIQRYVKTLERSDDIVSLFPIDPSSPHSFLPPAWVRDGPFPAWAHTF